MGRSTRVCSDECNHGVGGVARAIPTKQKVDNANREWRIPSDLYFTVLVCLEGLDLASIVMRHDI